MLFFLHSTLSAWEMELKMHFFNNTLFLLDKALPQPNSADTLSGYPAGLEILENA